MSSELENLLHMPSVTLSSTPNKFIVFCYQCSVKAQDYTYPCAEGKWQDDVPQVLTKFESPLNRADRLILGIPMEDPPPAPKPTLAEFIEENGGL